VFEEVLVTRVFVTGGTGFAGSHLIDSLLKDEIEVFGLVHPGSGHQPLPVHKNFSPVEGDLTDAEGIKTAIEKVEPDVIYHLGGIASPAYSWIDPAKTLAVNAGGTANLLRGAQQTNRPRIVVVTSALLYGSLSETDLPISEDTPPSPSHPYAVSKWTASLLIQLYWRRYSLHVIEARPFNHIGPRQARGFVVPDFASQLAKIELGKLDPIVNVGNLEAGRDFTDVRDITRAYRVLAERGEPGESYLVCSGKSVSIQQILDTLIDIAGIKVSIVKDPDRYRPLDTPVIYGSYEKIHRTTGWQPVIPLERSLRDAYLEWRERQSHEQG
jgi:GDP-4-dehydro-6-deoxy-D-mannose reductase